MKLKHILILLLVVLTSVLIVACSEMESLPDAMSLDSSIRAMIKSKERTMISSMMKNIWPRCTSWPTCL